MDRLSLHVLAGRQALAPAWRLYFFVFCFFLWENLLELAPVWVNREREGEARTEVDRLPHGWVRGAFARGERCGPGGGERQMDGGCFIFSCAW